jgi:hypothetical protein
MRGGFNTCLTERCLQFYSSDESAKLQSIHRGLGKECDINIPETRRIYPSHEAVQVFARSTIFELDKSRENNAIPRWWRKGKETPAVG